MTERQFRALNELRMTLNALVRECQDDDNFNSVVGDLEIFNIDMQEASDKVNDLLDQE